MLRNVCFIIIIIEYFKLLVSQKNNVCVCVGGGGGGGGGKIYILPGFNMLLHKCSLYILRLI